jgi:hypothetical protein
MTRAGLLLLIALSIRTLQFILVDFTTISTSIEPTLTALVTVDVVVAGGWLL